MPLTTYGGGLIMDHLFFGDPFAITNFYIGFWLSDPGLAGSMAGELSAGDYSRKIVSLDSSYTNTSDLVWPAAGSSWGSIGFIGLTDASTRGTGNLIAYESYGPLVIPAGTVVQILTGELTFTFP